MINAIDIAKLRNSELLQFYTDFLNIVHLNDERALQVEAEYNNLLSSREAIEDLYKISQGNPITEELQALDARRDAAISGLLSVINGYGYHFDAAISSHAHKLSSNLAVYGAGIARENYQSETATIRNIVKDWTETADLATAVAALNLADWQTELETINNSFATKYLDRTQELATASPDTMKQKRLESTTVYYALRDTINAYFTINKGAAPYDKPTNELNALITQYNVLLAGRKGGGVIVPPAPVPEE